MLYCCRQQFQALVPIDGYGFKEEDIIVYGESLGTGIVTELSSNSHYKAVILEAPFTSIFDIAQHRYKIYPAKFLTLDKFNNYNKIDKILSPLLIISGKNDEIVPHSHSLKVSNFTISSHWCSGICYSVANIKIFYF